MTGYAIIIVSTVLYAILPAIMKKVSTDISPWTAMAISMAVLAVVSFAMSFWREDLRNFDWSQNKVDILYLIILGVINAVGFYLAVRAYAYMPLWQQTMFSLLAPILTGFFAFLILGEPMSWRLLWGLVIISIGLFISTFDFSKIGS